MRAFRSIHRFAAIVCAFGVASCATAGPNTGSTNNTSVASSTSATSDTASAPVTASRDDGEGLSCRRRVKVPAVPAEYQWIDAHYPGSRLNMQALSECAGSPTDQLHITTADGRNLTVFFDISSFFPTQ